MSDGHTWMTTFWHEELDSVGNLRFCHFTPPPVSFKILARGIPLLLPDSVCQPRQSCRDSLSHSLVSSSLSSSPLSSSITPSLFHSRLKTNTSSTNPSHLRPWTVFTITGPDRTYHASRFIFSLFSLIFLLVPCGALSWLHVRFLLHVKYTVSYRIVSHT